MKEFTDTELAQEQWRDVEGYDGAYQVSDLGRVRSKKYGDWRVLRPGKKKQGYFTVSLCKDGKAKTISVHRIVASEFIHNDSIFNTEINHINEDKTDNRVSNLEWCDRQYNLTYNDLNLRKKPFIHQKYKQIKIKDLYNPELSINDNLEIFRANGIECTRQTIWQLRKELNLKHRSNYKLNKIKDLYRPDLTIKQNIALFKEQGIDCSKCTIIKLRKDLGLTKTD